MFLPVSRVPRWLPPALLTLAIFGAERALAQSVDGGAEDRAVVARRMADALINAPEVLTARAELRTAEANVDSAEYAAYPRVELGVSGSNGESPSRNNPASSVDSRLNASLKYTVWDFGRTSAKKQAVAFARQSALMRLDQSKEQFLRQMFVAYLQVSRYELLVEVGQDSRAALEELERLESRRVRLGGAGITDARVAASRLALSMNKALQFEQSLQDARLKLDALLGEPLPLRSLPPMQVPKAWLALAQADLARESDRSATLRAQRLNVDQARADLEAEESARYPAVDLTFIKRYEYPGGFSEKARVGLQVSMGSSVALEASARVERSISRLETEEQKLATLVRELRQKTLSGWQRQLLSGQRVTLLSSAAGESGAVVDARRKLNQAGRETTLALLDAQVEANNTLIDWVQAIYDMRVGEVELAGDTGRLLPEEGQELPWLMTLFTGEDYRSDVRHRLTAARVSAPAQKQGRLAPATLAGVPSFRIGLRVLPGPVLGSVATASASNVTFFRIDVKPFEVPAGSW